MNQFFSSLERPARYTDSADIDDVWLLTANLSLNGSNSSLVVPIAGKGSFTQPEFTSNDGTGEMESIAAHVFVVADLRSVNHLMGDHHRTHGLSTSQQSPATPGYQCIRTTYHTQGKRPSPPLQTPSTPPE